MKTLYDVQQILKKFGIFVHVGTRQWDIELMSLELKKLYKMDVITKEIFTKAQFVLNREHELESKHNNER